MEVLRRLRVKDACWHMELSLMLEMEVYFLFCMTRVVDRTPVIQGMGPMNQSNMSSRLKTLVEIHGWLHTFFAHAATGSSFMIIQSLDVVTVL